MDDRIIEKYLTEKSKGIGDWSEESLKKFAKTIGKDPKDKGFFEACVKRMSKHFSKDEAEGFCALVKDKSYGSTFWRGKDKTKKDVKKQVKSKQNVEKFPKEG